MNSAHRAHAVIGLISDTHGLLRPEAIAALHGVDMIIHAGDVGRADILDELQRIAPTVAVRGNVDRGAWAASLPATQTVEVGGARIHVLHDVHALAIDPIAAGVQAVIFGHSHRPLVEERHGVLFVNPDAAGPRRFRLPVTVGRLIVAGSELHAEIVELAV
jgi:putative phosphoesterase